MADLESRVAALEKALADVAPHLVEFHGAQTLPNLAKWHSQLKAADAPAASQAAGVKAPSLVPATPSASGPK